MTRTAGTTRVAVLACGNPSRGDDALGPLALERIARWVEAHPGVHVTLLWDFQLQIEHALDLVDKDAVLFLDAAASGPEPFAFTSIDAARDATWTSHALSPHALLHVFRTVTARAAPPAWVLAIRGHAFELGEGLGAAAAANLEAACAFVEDWLARVTASG